MSDWNIILILAFLIMILTLLIIALVLYNRKCRGESKKHRKGKYGKGNSVEINNGVDLSYGDYRVVREHRNGFLEDNSGTVYVGKLYKIKRNNQTLRIEVLHENRIEEIKVKDQIMVGRMPSAANVEHHQISNIQSVSRNHCIFQAAPEGIYIIDNNSTYHTYVNNNMITQKTLLKCGDTVRLGMNFEFRVIK